MGYIIAFLILVFSLMFLHESYSKNIKKKIHIFDYVLANMQIILDKAVKITYYGAQDKDTLLYIIEKSDKTQFVLRIHTYDGKIGFYKMELDYLYSKDRFDRYDGKLLIVIEVDDLRIDEFEKFSFIRKFSSEADMLFNTMKNKKIVFDNFYDGLVDMKRVSGGSSNTINTKDAKFVENIFK